MPDLDPTAAVTALRLKAARLQQEGDLSGAFDAYEQAVALAPQDAALLMALADLASQMQMHDVALKLWAHLGPADRISPQALNGHARALIAAARFGEAIDLLKAALQIHPGEPRLWTTLGLGLTYAGRAADATPFFSEGVRLDPTLPGAIYNRGLALCDLERDDEAEADFHAALALAPNPAERATIEFSLATTALGRGDLATGWPLYERRLSSDWHKAVEFQGAGQRLLPGDNLGACSILVLAEQGISDEIMFANALPDLIDEVGTRGRVVLAVEQRLVALFQRSFPLVEIVAHATPRVGLRPMRRPREPVGGPIDFWTPLASLAQRYRPTVADFPRAPFLRPDSARVAHWRAWLGERPAFGLTWRSGKVAGERWRYAPPLQQWVGLLQTPGAQFINVQYGDCAADLAQLSRMSGVEIRQPPALDIRADLDDLAALCMALDGVVGIQNATTVLAGACGAPVRFVLGPGSWFQLGQDQAPWFADGLICATGDFGDWTPALAKAAQAVQAIAASAPA